MSETASPAPCASPAPATPVPAKTEPAPATPATPTTPGSNATTPSGEAKPAGNFKEQFKSFSKFGDTNSVGKMITLSQSDKWMKQAGVIDKKLTTTDTGIYFKKFKSQKISVTDYEKFMEDLAKNKKLEVADLKSKMASCGAPGLHGTGHVKAAGAVDRLTDVSRYTGSHKQRFDETGKGKGLAGRKDVPETSGYVQGYQNKDSYLQNT